MNCIAMGRYYISLFGKEAGSVTLWKRLTRYPPDRGQVDRRSLLDNLDLLMLTVDELVDGGIILETDSSAIVARVLM